MRVTKETVLEWVNCLPETATDRSMIWHEVSIITEPFRAMRSVEYERFTIGSRAPEDERIQMKLGNFIEFYQAEYPYSTISFRF